MSLCEKTLYGRIIGFGLIIFGPKVFLKADQYTTFKELTMQY